MNTGSLSIMTYGGVITKERAMRREFYPHLPASPSLRRDHPPGPLRFPDHAPNAGPACCSPSWSMRPLAHLALGRRPALGDAPSDEAARLALIATLPDFAELQRRLNAARAGNLPRPLRAAGRNAWPPTWS